MADVVKLLELDEKNKSAKNGSNRGSKGVQDEGIGQGQKQKEEFLKAVGIK